MLPQQKKYLILLRSYQTPGIEIQHVDIGGGLGVHYPGIIPEYADRVGEKVPSPSELAAKVIAVLKPLNCEILFEPGRLHHRRNCGIDHPCGVCEKVAG